MGVSLADQGWTDEHGEAPELFLDWLRAIAPVIYEVRADAQEAAVREARQQQQQRR